MTSAKASALGALFLLTSSSLFACGSAKATDELDLARAQAGELDDDDASPNDTPATGAPAEAAIPPPPPGCPAGKWCSSLYPPTWTPEQAPDSEGRFLHDFSYAGYRYGEAPPAAPPGATYDVAEAYGADASGQSDATTAIQAAIDAASAAGGGVVFFPAGTYRVDRGLTVTTSGVVLRGTGVTSVLRFTKATGMGNKAHLTLAGAVTRDAVRPLAADAPARAREVFLADATGLAPGDDVAIGWTITADFVEEHGMTGTWTAFNGQHKPFFRNKVAAVDTSVTPHRVALEVPLRYPARMRDGAGVQKEAGHLREVGVEHLGLTDALTWETAWAEHHVSLLALRDVADAWVDDVHSVPGPGATGRSPSDTRVYHLRSSGVLIENAKRVSVLRSSMENPQNRGSGGNGYLFEISRTNEVLIADSQARNGRHNFIQNWGFGNAGTVFLRDVSTGSEMLSLIGGALTPEPSMSEHHHSLAMATLVDGCQLDDGFGFENRGAYSTGAGHSGTESVVWGASGAGKVMSKQFGWGYVVGTKGELAGDTDVDGRGGAGTAPQDFVEGRGQGDTLFPASLYDDQRARRTMR